MSMCNQKQIIVFLSSYMSEGNSDGTAATAESCGEGQFCNDTESRHSMYMKEGLEQLLSIPFGSQRCIPLVQALNCILSAFRNTKIGKLCTGPDRLYVANERYIMRSAPTSVSEKAPLSKENAFSKLCADDTLRTHLEKAKLLPENNQLTLAEGVTTTHDREVAEATSWGDVGHCWELERSPVLTKAILQRFHKLYKVEDIVANGASTPEGESASRGKALPEVSQEEEISSDFGRGVQVEQGQRSSTKGRSRPGAEDRSSSSMQGVPGSHSMESYTTLGKRSRGSESYPSMTSGGHSQRLKSRHSDQGYPRKKKSLAPAARSASNGLTLLHSRWNHTRAIVMLLEDRQVSLRWHDSQGCITTQPVDIVHHLPLLVAVILLFQRSGALMGGNCGPRLEGEVHRNRFNYTMEPERSLYLKHDFDRIGAKPFMPVELLAGRRGSVLRTCYHDLESIVWCLVWYCKEVDEWNSSPLDAVANSKISWAHNFGHIPPKDAREDIADLWPSTWNIVLQLTFMISNTLSPPTYRSLLDLIGTHIPYYVRPDKNESSSELQQWRAPSDTNVMARTDKKDSETPSSKER